LNCLNRAFLSLLALTLASCGSDFDSRETSVLASYNFFENSERRDLSGQEQRFILRAVKPGQAIGCTAFLIENNQDRILVGTARHCYNWKITEACNEDQIRITTDEGFSANVVGRCTQVIASSVLHDVAVIEIELRNRLGFRATRNQRRQFEDFYIPLRLADFSPTLGDRLQMYGYPADDARRARGTISENCWVLDPTGSMAADSLDMDNLDPRFQRYLDRTRSQTPNAQVTYFREALRQNIFGHNCSVYGGNSGGPIVLEDTTTVVGLPITYYPELYTVIPENFQHRFEDLKGFIDHHRAKLIEVGIIFE
jgi:hypothetical protein